MANNALIQGEANLAKTQGFVDYGAKLAPIMEKQRETGLQAKKENERKVERIQAGINTNMGKMKTDMDLTGLAPDQQTAVKDFLLSERNKYAEAANAISKIGDASDPQHAYYTDIMNGVNNSFTNLNKQLDSYKESKVGFADSSKNGLLSNGQDPDSFNNLSSIYRLEGEPAEMFVAADGNLAFAANGSDVLYNDLEEPILKDYELAKAYTAKANEMYTTGQQLTEVGRKNLMVDLDIMLQDPNAIKSIISGDFTREGLDFSDVVFDEANPQATRDQVAEIMLQSFSDVADSGYQEKQRAATAQEQKADRKAAARRTPRDPETKVNRSWITTVGEWVETDKVQKNITAANGEFVTIVPAGKKVGNMELVENEPGMLIPVNSVDEEGNDTGETELKWVTIEDGLRRTKKAN